MMQSYFALVGAPNCGKTVLFNGLTGQNAKVANYSGVTVDKRYGQLKGHDDVMIVDLPGTYSLRAATPDEVVTRDVVLGKLDRKPDAIIAVADATNLRMTLRMVLELKTLGLPMVVSLNLSDVAKSRGLQIDVKKLSELIGVPVLETVAINAGDVQAVCEAIAQLPRRTQTDQPSIQDADLLERQITHLDSQDLYTQIEEILQQVVKQAMVLPEWHKKLDALVLHKIWGIPILLVILFLVFQAVYAWSAPVMDGIEGLFGDLGQWVQSSMPEGILRNLLVDGVIAGVGSVLVFLPQITILFACCDVGTNHSRSA